MYCITIQILNTVSPLLEVPPYYNNNYYNNCCNNILIYRWMHYVNEYGLCLVKGAPTQLDEVARVSLN